MRGTHKVKIRRDPAVPHKSDENHMENMSVQQENCYKQKCLPNQSTKSKILQIVSDTWENLKDNKVLDLIQRVLRRNQCYNSEPKICSQIHQQYECIWRFLSRTMKN